MGLQSPNSSAVISCCRLRCSERAVRLVSYSLRSVGGQGRDDVVESGTLGSDSGKRTVLPPGRTRPPGQLAEKAGV